MARLLLNPHRDPGFRTAAPGREPLDLHRRLPGYAPTPLGSAPGLAARCGIRKVLVKDESSRLGLPAFKVLGAWWATYRALAGRLGRSPEPWSTVAELRDRLQPALPAALAAATDGNHGRAVARVARVLGIGARIFVPRGTAAPRIQGIAAEGAQVTEVDGTYDATVERAAAEQGSGALLIQDQWLPGYGEVPAWISDGYATLFWEAEEQLAARGEPAPDLVLVQIGVGALAGAAVRHFRREELVRPPLLVGVEPTRAACALASLEAGRLVTLPVGADASIMAGLNCGTPSAAAWPLLRAGLDAVIAVEDEPARDAMRLLAADGIPSGESGAAGAAGLLELLAGTGAVARERLGIGGEARALLLSTEGATDPEAYRRIVGKAPEAVGPHAG
ncbi:MAG: diaminopropionate ammonia-lyase [Candidatus Methylomirabilales bacterium]